MKSGSHKLKRGSTEAVIKGIIPISDPMGALKDMRKGASDSLNRIFG